VASTRPGGGTEVTLRIPVAAEPVAAGTDHALIT
jgi:hypothetical protein